MYPILTLTAGKYIASSVCALFMWIVRSRRLSPAVRGKCIAERKHGRSMAEAVSALTRNLNSATRPDYQKAASQVHRTAEPDRRHCIWIWTTSLRHMPVWGQERRNQRPGKTAIRPDGKQRPRSRKAPHLPHTPMRARSDLLPLAAGRPSPPTGTPVAH